MTVIDQKSAAADSSCRAVKQRWTPTAVQRALLPGFRKLRGKSALITGGDSGIGRSVAVLFAREGADVAITYLNEHEDATETAEAVR